MAVGFFVFVSCVSVFLISFSFVISCSGCISFSLIYFSGFIGLLYFDKSI